MSSTTVNKTAAKDNASTAILGVDKRLASIISISLGGVTYTPVQIKIILQGDVDAMNTIDATKAAWSKAVADGRESRAEATAMLRNLRAYLIATSGAGAVGLLADFGFLPPKPKKVAAKTKAAAVAKTLATRAARHTMGKNQKKAVKGDVTGVTLKPTTAATPVATSVAGTSSSPTAGATSSVPTVTPTPHTAT